ncbi:RagB/SusD family nutrient uptake outer membrane protein [Chitinophagaceae bacterium 26-R-25]|nr:RagB/SusD family nutrient uptake outer membrane protein [Chitinophagaceae bacterium 26-R-25]
MKRNIYIIIALGLVSFTSCKKFLDTTPQSFLSPDQYYIGTNITSALAGVYNPLNGVSGEYLNGLFSCTDETYYGGQSRTASAAQDYFYDYTNGNVNNLWKNCYTGIERANVFMQNLDTTKTSSTSSSADLQAAYGEALFLRAYYHFLLVSNFGSVPLKLKPTVATDNFNVPATPVQEVYNQVVADMKAAESKVYPISKAGASKVSKSAVDGILARVYLYMAGYPLNGGKTGAQAMYDSSLTYSQKVINSGLHSLNPSYSQVFVNQAADVYETKESIWEIDFWGNDANTIKSVGLVGSQNGIAFGSTTILPGSTYNVQQTLGFSYGFIFATKKLYDLYDSTDVRRDWNIQNFSYTVNTTSSPMISKVALSPLTSTPYNYYRNTSKWRREFEQGNQKTVNNSAINFPLLRYSDVLLMFAEADLQVNGGTCTTAGIAAINAVRERGYGLVGSTAPLKSLTLVTPGSGYLRPKNTSNVEVFINNYNNASVGNVNNTTVGNIKTGNWLGYASTITGTLGAADGQVTALTLLSGGLGFSGGTTTITLGTPWTANTTFAANQQVYYNGNLYTVPTAGTSNGTPPTHTSGSSTAASTGLVFTWAGVPATAQGVQLTKSDVDLTTVNLQNIIDERARELCYEGLRKGDLVRWGIFFQTMTDVNNQILAWPSSNFSGSLNQTMAATGYSNVAYNNPVKYQFLPIPSSEMNQNRSIKQNPGW